MSLDKLNGSFIKKKKINKTSENFKNKSIESTLNIFNEINTSSKEVLKQINTSNYYNNFESNQNILNKKTNSSIGTRKDIFGTSILKGRKEHKIYFKDNIVEVIEIESYKEYLNEKVEFIKNDNAICACTCRVF